MTCERFQAAVVASDEVAVDLTRQGAVADHAASCASCRAWVAAYIEGCARWLDETDRHMATNVMATTAGDVCASTRRRLTGVPDSQPDSAAAALVADHLGRCEECRVFADVWSRVSQALPGLAELDPGPGFASAVLARTSRRRRSPWLDRLRAAGTRLARRPRFAWEVAYAVTLIWLLTFGPPVAVLDWTTARVGAVTADTVPAGVRDAGSQMLARAETLHEQWAGQVTKVSDAVETGGLAAVHYVQDTRTSAASWWARGLAGVADMLSSSWRALVDWLDRAFGDGTDGEPASAPVRSSQ